MTRFLSIFFGLFLAVSSSASAEGYIKTKSDELDEIYSLLSMAVVYKDWQMEKRRGHNIGGVLVDPAGELVFWARNSRYITQNASQHGEVRLITSYLSCNPSPEEDNREVSYLGVPNQGEYEGAIRGKGFTLYSTLEPCAMCTGMMFLTNLWRAVYVQEDPDFGNAHERLSQDTSIFYNGHEPYPRSFEMYQVKSEFAERLDESYASSSSGITKWLRSEEAKKIFKEATTALMNYDSSFGNQGEIDKAKKFLQDVVDSEYQSDMLSECPETQKMEG